MQPTESPAPPSRAGLVAAIFVMAAVFVGAFFLWLRSRDAEQLPVLWPAPEFSLTDEHGQPRTKQDLLGHVWAVDFVFTRCQSICPVLGSRFYELQEQLPIRLVSITVDPDHDRPEVLRAYEQKYYASADTARWHWLTGEKRAIYDLMQTGFKVGEPGAPRAPDDIPHSPHVLLVDARGRVRGTYEIKFSDRADFDRLLADARALHEQEGELAPIRHLPALNAGLNSASALFLLSGYFFIRRRLIGAHKACMLAACATSVVFLASYLTYHHFHGTTPFTGQGAIRPVYFTILVSHTVLAGLTMPLVLVSLYNAFAGRFERHRAIARWTLPIWVYVSLSGVLVYVLLYLLYPSH